MQLLVFQLHFHLLHSLQILGSSLSFFNLLTSEVNRIASCENFDMKLVTYTRQLLFVVSVYKINELFYKILTNQYEFSVSQLTLKIKL
ncbi:hypothetical protein Hanom_Chr04g00360321 [Helianthus anomalus]